MDKKQKLKYIVINNAVLKMENINMINFETTKKAKNIMESAFEDFIKVEKKNISAELESYKSGDISVDLEDDAIFKMSAIGGFFSTLVLVLILNAIFNLTFSGVMISLLLLVVSITSILFYVLKKKILKIKDKNKIKDLEKTLNFSNMYFEVLFEEKNAKDEILNKIAGLMGEEVITSLFLLKNNIKDISQNDYITLMKKTGKNVLLNKNWEEKINNRDLNNMIEDYYMAEKSK